MILNNNNKISNIYLKILMINFAILNLKIIEVFHQNLLLILITIKIKIIIIKFNTIKQLIKSKIKKQIIIIVNHLNNKREI